MEGYTDISIMTNPETEKLKEVSKLPDWFMEMEFDNEDNVLYKQTIGFWYPTIRSFCHIATHNSDLFRELISQYLGNSPSVEIINERNIFKVLTLVGDDCANVLLSQVDGRNSTISKLLDSVNGGDYESFSATVESNGINLNSIERVCNVLFNINNYVDYIKGVARAIADDIDVITEDQWQEVFILLADKLIDTLKAIVNHDYRDVVSINLGLETGIRLAANITTDENSDIISGVDYDMIMQISELCIKMILIAYGQYELLLNQTERRHMLNLIEKAPIKIDKYIQFGRNHVFYNNGSPLEKYNSYVLLFLFHDNNFRELLRQLDIPIDKLRINGRVSDKTIALPALDPTPESERKCNDYDWDGIYNYIDLKKCSETGGCPYRTFVKLKKNYSCPNTPAKKTSYLKEVYYLVNEIAKAGIIENTNDPKLAFYRTLTDLYIETDIKKVRIIPQKPTTKDNSKSFKLDINLNAVMYICKEMFDDNLNTVFEIFDCENPYGETGYTKNAKLDSRLGDDTITKIKGCMEKIRKRATFAK